VEGAFTERRVALDDQARAHTQTALRIIGQAIAEGFMPAAPAHDACRSCAYRPVCGPHEESRSALKPPDRLSDLKTLRALP
jgi:hypothetical protein